MFALPPLSPLGPRVGLRDGPVLCQRPRIAMDVEPGRMVSATLGEIHFPAARGEKCSLRVIHLLCSEVVNRRAAWITAWSGARLSRLPAGAGRLGKSTVICFLCVHGWEDSWMGTHWVRPSVESHTHLQKPKVRKSDRSLFNVIIILTSGWIQEKNGCAPPCP